MNPFCLSKLHSYRRTILIAILHRRRNRQRRKLYIRELFKNRLNDATYGEFGLLKDLENDEEYFHSYFRMTKEQLDWIYGIIKTDITHLCTHSNPIPPKMRLAMTIRFLAHGGTQKALGVSFRTHKSTVGLILRETMTAILKHMKQMFLPTPSHEEWKRSEEIFREKWNFPFCVGALDGKHIRLKAPWKSGSLNFNYKGFFSLVVLAVVSGDYRFIAVDVGAPGSESDAAIFSNCSFLRLAESKSLELPENGSLGSPPADVPHVIVGDEAFPLKPWLMRPYPGTELDERKRVYNYRLSRARRVVENTFGIWAAQWRILFNPIDADDDLTSLIIWTTIVLHNFLRQDGVDDSNESEISSSWRDIPRVGSNNYTTAAFSVRETFADYFVSPEGQLGFQYEHVNRST